MKRSILFALVFAIASNLLPKTVLANETFDAVCAACHTGGLRGMISGAPNVKRPDAWRPHLSQHSPDQMLRIVLNGTADHKARGGCDSCSDQQITEALEYLLSVVQ
ncbi:MAG: c-type cytochrome [Dinoroseobacter sp.]|nr:c-type cytochrome [Dinoroseobacter sp.]